MKVNATPRSRRLPSVAAGRPSREGAGGQYLGRHRGSAGDGCPGPPGRHRRQDDAPQDTVLAGTKVASC